MPTDGQHKHASSTSSIPRLHTRHRDKFVAKVEGLFEPYKKSKRSFSLQEHRPDSIIINHSCLSDTVESAPSNSEAHVLLSRSSSFGAITDQQSSKLESPSSPTAPHSPSPHVSVPLESIGTTVDVTTSNLRSDQLGTTPKPRQNPIQESKRKTSTASCAQSSYTKQPSLPFSIMATNRLPSSLNRLSIYSQQLSRSQLKTRQEAKEQQAVIHEQLRRANEPIPPYEFQNYIGKGSFGRVYVAQDTRPDGFGRVAIKILDVDSVDFKANLVDRDTSFEGFLQEFQTLRQLESYGAKNVNLIYDVLEVHSQLWIISEYCPGGSVHTLMQAFNNKVEEKYIIPIARELAIGLDAVHKAFVIHRDIKAANVMIHEEGRLQIIDFGVAGTIVTEEDKRKTMIGTPHWMGPEILNPGTKGYGKEVDTWAFGCTLVEMATGFPPRRHLGAPSQLEKENRLRGPPKLKPEQGYSRELCDLVTFTLEIDPNKRPSMQQVLEHPYLKDTEFEFPTTSLKELVREFQDWMNAGGQRQSLVTSHGAQAATMADRMISRPEWRFSTLESTEFLENLPSDVDERISFDLDDNHLSAHLDQVADMTSTQAQEDAFNLYDASEPSSPYLSTAEMTPSGSPRSSTTNQIDLDDCDWGYSSETIPTTVPDESKVMRGERQLGRLFDQRKSEYKFPGLNSTQSDLPLRNQTPKGSSTNLKGNEVDASSIGNSNFGSLQLMDPSTLKAKKGKDRPPTLAWEFPTGAPTDAFGEQAPPEIRAEASAVTYQNLDASTPDFLDDDIGAPSDDAEEDLSMTPSTASFASQRSINMPTSTTSFASQRSINMPPCTTSFATQESMDMDMEMSTDMDDSRKTLDLDLLLNEARLSVANEPYHVDASTPQLPPAQDASFDPDATLRNIPTNHMDYSNDNMNGTNNNKLGDVDRHMNAPVPPSAAALASDAPPEVILADMERMLASWGAMMSPLAKRYEEYSASKNGVMEDEEDSAVGVS